MSSKSGSSSKRWLLLALSSVLLIVLGLAIFNVLTDPFGAFGDPIMKWWSYDETLNPRVAKHSYLKQNWEKYDSYIVGCSNTSSFPVEALNEYCDANFYNLFTYGGDMLRVEQFCRYLLEHYEVKNLVLNAYFMFAINYGFDEGELGWVMPWDLEGSSPISYYPQFLFADPRIGWEKLQHWRTDSLVQAKHDVFNEATGAYDKSLRDVEHIGDMDSYLAEYPVFVNYPTASVSLPYIQECMGSIRVIRDLCEERGVNLIVVTIPMYWDNLMYFDQSEIEEYYTELTKIVPFWDFTASSISRDPRYYYDEDHFRNCVGEMALARIFGNETVYIPDDFGVYVTPENVHEVVSGYWSIPEPNFKEYTTKVPILMYHSISDDAIPAERFEEQLALLSRAGYTTVTFDDLRAYVVQGIELPEKPIVITFDDGYTDNVTNALPILQRYQMKATIFVIGCSVGKDTYKDTGIPMHEHFSLEQAKELLDSGLIAIGSHGFDIHQVSGYDDDPIREGILQRDDESEEEYVEFLRNDCAAFDDLMKPVLGEPARTLAYPYGYYSNLSKIVLRELGVDVTVTFDPGINTLVKGIPQSLLDLSRYNMEDIRTDAGLLRALGYEFS